MTGLGLDRRSLAPSRYSEPYEKTPVMLRVLLIVSLSALDGFLTLREGGLEIEGNPALRWLMSCDGWIYAFWFHKTIGVGACAWVLGRYRPVFLWLVALLLAGVFAVHAIVVSWCDGCVVS